MRLKHPILILNISVLCIFFALSVFVRSGNLNKHLGQPSEWLTGHMLVTLTVWDEVGLQESKFGPRYNFNNPADKHCRSLAGVMDEDLNSYYVSYPPFGFYLPYFVFKGLGVTPDVLPLQIFNMALHLIATLFIMLILYQLFSKSFKKDFFIPAYAAALIYLFTPGMLWFHSNIYFVDMLVQVLFIIEVYLLVRILKTGISRTLLIWLGVINFLAVYTEWLAVFVAFTAFIITFFYFLKQRKFVVPLIIAATTAGSLGLTVYQYAQLGGFDQLIEVSKNKYDERSGRSEEGYALTYEDELTYEILEKNYQDEYRVTKQLATIGCYFLIVFMIVSIIRKKRFDWVQFLIWLLIIVPIALHYIAFFNFNALHDFGTLKTGFLFAFIIGVFIHYTLKLLMELSAKYKYVYWFGIGVLMFFTTNDNIRFYHSEHSNPVPDLMYDIGLAAKGFAEPTDGVYTYVWYNAPEALYYAKRNILSAADVNQAKDFMKVRGERRGVWIDIDFENQKIKNVRYIYPE